MVVNVAERVPAHARASTVDEISSQNGASAAGAISVLSQYLDERRNEDGGGRPGAGGASADGDRSEGRSVMADVVAGGVGSALGPALCNHDVVGAVVDGGAAVRIDLPELEARGPVDLEFCVSCDGGRTFSAPCPALLLVRYLPEPKTITPALASCLGGTRMILTGRNLTAIDDKHTVW